MEELFLYAHASDPATAEPISRYLAERGLPFHLHIVQPGSPEEADISAWSEGLSEVYPLLRVGRKIRANLFQPSLELVGRCLGQLSPEQPPPPDLPPYEELVLFTTTWCPDCMAMERYLNRHGANVRKVYADTEGYMQHIVRWSGGRRTVPSFQWGNKVRMFNPSAKLVGQLVLGLS